MISMSSVVIDAWRVRLYSKVSLPSMSFAFFVESNLPATWTDESKLDWKQSPVTA